VRVLHVTPSYEPAWGRGGVVSFLSALCRSLVQHEVDVEVFTTDSAKRQRLNVKVDTSTNVGGVKVTYFRVDSGLGFAFSRAMTSAIRRRMREFDIVHVTSMWCYPGLVATYFARKYGIPYIESPEGCLIPEALAHKGLMKKLLWQIAEQRNFRRARAIHFTTRLERAEAEHLRLSTPSFIIPHGFNLSSFADIPSQSAARARLNLPATGRIVGYLGRLHSHKALDYLVKAFHHVAKSIPDCHLVLAGPDDGFRQVLEELIRSLDLDGRVIFTGFVDASARLDLLAACDLFALVSHSENFGNAGVEALAAGKPVLASERVGIAADICKHKMGVVVPVDETRIAQALQVVLSSPEALRLMGEQARQKTRELYSSDVVATHMVAAYDDVLSGRRTPALNWAER
jgi:glycosyltransferase involved in cell wall biosynthesis